MKRVLGGLGVAGLLAGGGAAVPAATSAALVAPVPFARLASHNLGATPPTTSQCLKSAGIRCYGPGQFQRAYNLRPLYRMGNQGQGQTIAIVDAFGSPTAARDLKQFDKDYGLPDPPSFRVIQPAGKVPPYDPKNGDRGGWAFETSLDIEYAHAMAPKANILLVETPVSETQGVAGFPEIVKAENYVINHHLAQVISQSFGTVEPDFPTAQSLLRLRGAYKNAAAHHVTVVSSSGDSGPTGATLGGRTYARRVAAWPADDPLNTAVGGLQLFLNDAGRRIAPDRVWNETERYGSPVATGSGLSRVFARPSYQRSVRGIVGPHRGYPDISLSAAVNGGALVYLSFRNTAIGITSPGYYIVGGTSESAPQFAGIVALATQRAGHNLGLINDRLYRIGSGQRGIVDITRGNNTVFFTRNGHKVVVKGWRAKPGYDLASGLGTVNGAKLVPALAGR